MKNRANFRQHPHAFRHNLDRDIIQVFNLDHSYWQDTDINVTQFYKIPWPNDVLYEDTWCEPEEEKDNGNGS